MKRILSFFLAMSLLLIGCSEKNDKSNKAIVKVNNEYIYQSEIEAVYNQLTDTSITFEKIVEDTISEILVIQQAPFYNISVSEEEIIATIKDYKNSYPDYYYKALEDYSYDEFKKRIADKGIYIKVREHYLSTYTITNQDIANFVKTNNLEKHLQKYSNTEILTCFKNEINNFVLKEWIKDLREKATIEYLE